jgi:K+:H+ antiporter
MHGDLTIFRDLAYVIVAAVVGGALAYWARQPLILGYVLGGMVVGPGPSRRARRSPIFIPSS